MAYNPGNRPRAGSAASGTYVPTEYQSQYQPTAPSSLRLEAGRTSPPQTYNPPRPEAYQSNAHYQPTASQLHPHPDPPLPIGEHVLPSSRRASSSRPRLSTDSRPHSDSGRSHRSHHSSRSHYDDTHRGRGSHESYGHEEHHHDHAVSGDRASLRSRRSSHHSHYSLRRHFEDDAGREPPLGPLKRADTRRPTLGGSMISLFEAAKKSLGLK